jgi:hypothetical protein
MLAFRFVAVTLSGVAVAPAHKVCATGWPVITGTGKIFTV